MQRYQGNENNSVAATNIEVSICQMKFSHSYENIINIKYAPDNKQVTAAVLGIGQSSLREQFLLNH